ncbi:MAG: hypothetical protein EA422_09710 [Gemmatimonadales bacterium]|nr:MAG: hypothetical protein EA422_09710 [Gemmatimonadales bacterium]
MYRHCLFCASDLGDNHVVEAFPVGRRLAFDPARGRLWVICRACERWNLTPLEERWEAVEAAERIFRETPLRVSGEQIGLARHREGLDLVRIGEPVRGEFAAWRYGDQFGRRRRRYIRNGVVGGGLAVGVLAGSVGVVGGVVALQLGANVLQVAGFVRQAVTPSTQVRLTDGRTLKVKPKHFRSLKVRPGGDEGADWSLVLDHDGGSSLLVGPDAVRGLRAILPRINQAGASGGVVKDAVRELEEVGTAEAYFAQLESRARRTGHGYMPVQGHPAHLRLALEMAAHEDAERVALEGELAWLEEAWREAEEIAAISDELTLPDRVRVRFQELKARWGR